MSEQPFRLSVPQAKLDALKTKLASQVFPDELEDAGWDYGVPLGSLKPLVDHWATSYDWRKAENAINDTLPMFTRDINVDGFGTLNIHYVHSKSKRNTNAIPLLFLHGWPGSFLEVQKILPLLTSPQSDSDPSFHVVAPSLPGFGFSSAPKKKGFKSAQYAEVGNKLMLALGYDKYVTQGGDWGSLLTRKIAQDYGGKHSMAWHTNAPTYPSPSLFSQPISFISHLVTPYTSYEKEAIERGRKFIKLGRGYAIEQGTAPQTLGYALTDSPIGLLAWIYEKLVKWTDNYPWTPDEVLTWISIYLFSAAGPAATLRIYYEIFDDSERVVPPHLKPRIPFGASYFPKELMGGPRAFVRNAGNLVFEKQHDEGGHFAAHEQPEALVGDLREMFGRKGKAFGVVPSASGYDSV